jgi:tetratricopeptide (TPR) repeat protein
MQQTNRAFELFDLALASTSLNYQEAAAIANYCAQLGNFAKLETALEKLVSLAPGQPEARYDLAALQAITGRTAEAMQNLKTALEASAKRLAADRSARDLVAAARTDPRFAALHSRPEFQKLVPPQ